MQLSRRSLLLSTSAIGLSFSLPAWAESEGERLKKKNDSERYEKKTDKSDVKAGCARIAVKASPDTIEDVVTDFKNYARFISKFKKARIVGKEGDDTLVYLSVPILHGAGKIWAVVRFKPIQKDGDTRTLTGSMVKGNVKRLDATWHIKPIDDDYTQLNCELLIVPKLPVPGSVVTGEVAYAADEAVSGSRKRAEKLRRRKKRRKKG